MVLSGNENSVKRDFFPKLARALANAPFAEELVAAYYCAFDRATPVKAKGIVLAALAYFIMPLDAVPDFILGLGFTDDMAVLIAAISTIRTHMKPHHRDMARATLDRIRSQDDGVIDLTAV